MSRLSCVFPCFQTVLIWTHDTRLCVNLGLDILTFCLVPQPGSSTFSRYSATWIFFKNFFKYIGYIPSWGPRQKVNMSRPRWTHDRVSCVQINIVWKHGKIHESLNMHERSDEQMKVWSWTHESLAVAQKSGYERTEVLWTHESMIRNAWILWWTHEGLIMKARIDWLTHKNLDMNSQKFGERTKSGLERTKNSVMNARKPGNELTNNLLKARKTGNELTKVWWMHESLEMNERKFGEYTKAFKWTNE